MPADTYRDLSATAMIDALCRREAVLVAIRSLDDALGRRMTQLPDYAKTVADLRSADPQTQDRALRTGRGQIAEMMGYCAAAAARASGLDRGLTELAERWLDSLSSTMNLPRVAVVIPSQQESTDAATQVVNLRIPFEGVWGITVAVHEYGHFIAGKLTRRRDVGGLPQTTVEVERFLRQYERDHPNGEPYYRRGHELVADAIAVALAGPAFSHHCLRYRFDLSGSDGASATHPSFARRMQVQLRVLQHLGSTDNWVKPAARMIAERWQQLATAAATVADPGDDGLDEIAEFAIAVACDDPTLDPARYREHRVAAQLAGSGLRSAGVAPSFAHVVNAAWVARVNDVGDDPAEALRIEASALALLREGTG